jgi:hypothetical protein
MKDPVGIFGCWRGFSYCAAPLSGSHADTLGCPSAGMGTNRNLRGLCSRRGAPMPAWLELLLNVIAFAGFIGIAKYHRSRGENLPDR